MEDRLVIFDCDGVLVDSEAISNRVLAGMLTAEGLPTTLRQARREYQGLLLGEIVLRVQDALGHALADGWAERYERERDAAFSEELTAVPGAGDAVRRVRAAGIAVCVASQGRLSKTRLSLGLTGLAELFPEGARFSAETVPRGKPHPDLFLHAAAAMGAQAARSVVVEDTPSGATAGVAAGMRVLGYAADSDERALRASGAEIVWSMTEVPERLGL